MNCSNKHNRAAAHSIVRQPCAVCPLFEMSVMHPASDAGFHYSRHTGDPAEQLPNRVPARLLLRVCCVQIRNLYDAAAAQLSLRVPGQVELADLPVPHAFCRADDLPLMVRDETFPCRGSPPTIRPGCEFFPEILKHCLDLRFAPGPEIADPA